MKGSFIDHNNDCGFVVLAASFLMVAMIACLTCAVELARIYDERQKIQIAADAAALAGANVLSANVDYASVLAVVTSMARANAVTLEEVTQVAPQCGTWSDGLFHPQLVGVCDTNSTAISVTIRRVVPTSFSGFANLSGATIVAEAVGYKPLSTPGTCIRPFGVEASFLQTLNIQPGGTFILNGTQGAGNWGKIDLDGNSSSGQQYTSLMLNNLCDEAIVRGNEVSVGTGNAQIRQVFDTLLMDSAPPFAYQGMVFAVTTDFPAGNGLVKLLKFIRVDLISQRGSGQGWQGTFRLVDLEAVPESQDPPQRQLMQ